MLSDRGEGEKTAVAHTPDADTVITDLWASDEVSDPRDEILEIPAAPISIVELFELHAETRAAAHVGREDGVALLHKKLDEWMPPVQPLRGRPSVRVCDEWNRLFRAGGVGK